jgi:hypothetical protein
MSYLRVREIGLSADTCPACGRQFRHNEKRGAVVTLTFTWGITMVGVCQKCAVTHKYGAKRQKAKINRTLARWCMAQYTAVMSRGMN